jgi:hypothetical protein
MAYSGVWVAVQDPGRWALRLLFAGVMRFLASRSVGLARGGLHLFMYRGSGDYMTSAVSLWGAPGKLSWACPRESRAEVCPAKEGVDSVHTYVLFI